MYLQLRKKMLLPLLGLLAVILGSCGGGAALAPEAQALDQTPAALETASALEALEGTAPEVSGLPFLPEGTEGLKGGSAVDGNKGLSVRGNDFINAANESITDRGLLLEPPGFGLAWALYGIQVGDADVAGLAVDAAPLEGSAGYYIALGNYSRRSWTISPLQDGPARLQLPDDASFVSPAGTLYFVVFSVAPPGCLMKSATASLDRDPARPLRRSHGPWGLEASDGTLDGGIGLHWNAPRRGVVDHYLVFRRLQPGETAAEDELELHGFVAIGRTVETRFLDDNAREGVRYFYSVLAVNERGRSAHSNVDGGWWGERYGGTGLFITGLVTSEDGRPVPDVSVGLVGRADRSRVLSNDKGRFVFRNLESGNYVLHAATGNDRLVATPERIQVELADSPVRSVHFIVRLAADLSGDGGGDQIRD